MTTNTALLCPKCGGRMRNYERSAIFVEQCEDCRGIFLDHGELERLIDAEGGGWSGRVGPPTESPVAHRPRGRDRQGDDHRRDDGRRSKAPDRREGQLSNLIDLFGDGAGGKPPEAQP